MGMRQRDTVDRVATEGWPEDWLPYQRAGVFYLVGLVGRASPYYSFVGVTGLGGFFRVLRVIASRVCGAVATDTCVRSVQPFITEHGSDLDHADCNL